MVHPDSEKKTIAVLPASINTVWICFKETGQGFILTHNCHNPQRYLGT